jgi:hypothetical protein
MRCQVNSAQVQAAEYNQIWSQYDRKRAPANTFSGGAKKTRGSAAATIDIPKPV